ncbi:pyridoxal phosphate-dependent aminotransferase [Paracoccus pacificus]|uniref:aspartate transaminase n=1 Tax=Paracoccus pacificus TaxID=1463598 RepID=A0ABW4R2P8_9RHOB
MRYSSVGARLDGLGSGKWAVHFLGRKLRAQGRDIIELTIGEPDLPVDPDLIEVAVDAMRAGRTAYSDGHGESALLAAIAAKYSRRSGRQIGTDQVICLPGTQNALYAVMQTLVETGDAVAVPDPCYATYEGVIRATGARMVPVPMPQQNGFRLTPQALEAALTPDCRALLLNTPHNPTGVVLNAAEIAAITEVCRRRDLWIISDEVYEELIFGETAFASPFDRADAAERTVVVSSISKSHAAPGFRSGWVVGPAEFCNRLLPLAEMMLFGNQPFIADMTVAALTRPNPTAATLRQMLSRRARLVCDAANATPGLRADLPQAGMFVMLDVSGTGMDGDQFARSLLVEQGVSTMPGGSFGHAARDFLRLSLTVPDETLTQAMQRISDHARAMRERTA